jgi:CRISPR-associated endonuclease/helicase Cas3
LCRDWGCTFILSTATKPAFERPSQPDPALVTNPKDTRWNPGSVREIIHDPQSLHTRLKRVHIDWRITQAVAWAEVATWMRKQPASLCIVNTRDQAQQLSQLLADSAEPGTLFHLSTRMCPAHRLEVIGSIRQRLRDNLPTFVVSTQLIEAGVDLDFPVVFRAIGPLDSIIQAAGRADREGILTAKQAAPAGRLIVFLPEDKRMPPNEYKEAAAIAQTIVGLEPNLQTDDLAALAHYFERYYRDAETGTDLLQFRAESKFKTLSQNFEMINALRRDVFVPYRAGKELIDQLHAQGFLDKPLRQQLQPYSVGLQPYEFERSRMQFNQVRDQEIWTASENSYDPQLGLQSSTEQPLIL